MPQVNEEIEQIYLKYVITQIFNQNFNFIKIAYILGKCLYRAKMVKICDYSNFDSKFKFYMKNLNLFISWLIEQK